MQVLDVGSGSGYLTAVFAQLVCSRPAQGQESENGCAHGEVVGMDYIPELVELAKQNLRKSERMTQLMSLGQLQILQVHHNCTALSADWVGGCMPTSKMAVD